MPPLPSEYEYAYAASTMAYRFFSDTYGLSKHIIFILPQNDIQQSQRVYYLPSHVDRMVALL